MKRASQALGVMGGLLLLVLVGCNSIDLGLGLALTSVDAAANVRVMDGSPDVVAVSLTDTLKRTGFEATVYKTNDTTVVESKTAAGVKFALVLKSVTSADGREQTHVSMEWMDSRTDQQASVKIFTDIDRQPGTKK